MDRKKRRIFTLAEVIIVAIIVAVTATVSVPVFRTTVRRARDREAVSMLFLIGETEDMYMTENIVYRDCGNNNQCNARLQLELSTSADRNWNYTVTGEPNDYNITATSTANNPPARTCTFNRGDAEPICQ